MTGSQDAWGCAEAREVVHLSLDAEIMDAGPKQRLEAHLSCCESCREFTAELRAIQGGLRSLPELKLPDEVLERVWDRTTHARATHRKNWRRNLAAAAAVVVIVLSGLWLRNG